MTTPLPNLRQLEQTSLSAIAGATTLKALEEARVDLLGKSGKVTGLLKELGTLPPESRKTFGADVNRVKEAVSAALDTRKAELETAALNRQLQEEAVDVTLPAAPYALGKMHPVSYVIEEVEQILSSLGFDPATGPEIESDFNNFTALNIPDDHPARQDHDTFYLPPGADGATRLLRTHTSPVQIRAMSSHQPPLRVQAIGRVFRCDSDLTHTPQFHQVEGFALDTDIHMGHLKGVLQTFLNAYFEKDIPLRLRPSYFPFTEPSAEVDIGCVFCSGHGCRVCKHTGWLEVLGSGMIHRNVLKHCGIDPTKWQGFAFGCGIERLTMLKYGINDLRLFYDSQTAFLRHFGKAAALRPL
jgi:phenylalanyl-tRNA synthetase alpha chain